MIKNKKTFSLILPCIVQINKYYNKVNMERSSLFQAISSLSRARAGAKLVSAFEYYPCWAKQCCHLTDTGYPGVIMP